MEHQPFQGIGISKIAGGLHILRGEPAAQDMFGQHRDSFVVGNRTRSVAIIIVFEQVDAGGAVPIPVEGNRPQDRRTVLVTATPHTSY